MLVSKSWSRRDMKVPCLGMARCTRRGGDKCEVTLNAGCGVREGGAKADGQVSASGSDQVISSLPRWGNAEEKQIQG